MAYKLTPNGVQRVSDGAFIQDPGQDAWSPAWEEYTEWLKTPGNLPQSPSLDDLRAQVDDGINAARLAANRSSFTFAGKEIACDELSRSDIDGVASYAALYGALPPQFPGAWKALDNSFIPIPDVDTFKTMIAAMAATGTANFIKAQQLKQALAAATTAEEIQAIAW